VERLDHVLARLLLLVGCDGIFEIQEDHIR
jgi:hypothetical protein